MIVRTGITHLRKITTEINIERLLQRCLFGSSIILILTMALEERQCCKYKRMFGWNEKKICRECHQFKMSYGRYILRMYKQKYPDDARNELFIVEKKAFRNWRFPDAKLRYLNYFEQKHMLK
uniref:Uncharacterized protein n=1 Tax=Onchocerca volvulus TaxID=6282 RepID=A0A8R1TSU6_ONCVO